MVYMLSWLGYIDGIHGTPYIAAPWILWDISNLEIEKWILIGWLNIAIERVDLPITNGDFP